MPIFDCPICHFKSFTENESNEHYANKHKKEVQPIKPEVKKVEEKNKIKPAEPEVKKPDEPKKPFIMPDFVKRFLHKNVSITMIDGSTVSGELTGFNNYELMIDEQTLIQKHAMIKMQDGGKHENDRNI